MSLVGKGLGKGLDALIPGTSQLEEESAGSISEIDINLIDANPYQPRTDFDDESLKELAASIMKHGILQPLLISPSGDHYELVVGERRLRAARLAGLKRVPVITRKVSDHEKLEVAIIENVQRKDLNPIEEASSYRKLIEEFNYSQDAVAEVIGKSRSLVANKLRLLSLETEIKRALKEGKITEGHAKALLAIENKDKRRLLFEKILTEGFNVRDVEKIAANISPKKASKANAYDKNSAIEQLAKDLGIYLETKVFIKDGKKGGKIEITYYSAEELSRIYQKIKGLK